MTMTVSVAQMRIARDLHSAEAALDDALLRQARLLETMITARRETGSEPFIGQEALLRLAKSQQAILDAGNEMARVHGRLRHIQSEVGGGDDCPPMAGTGLQETASHVAGAA